MELLKLVKALALRAQYSSQPRSAPGSSARENLFLITQPKTWHKQRPQHSDADADADADPDADADADILLAYA